MTKRFLQSSFALFLAPLLMAQQNSNAPGKLDGVIAPSPTLKTKAVRYAEIRLVLLETVSSATAQKGQSVSMTVASDVIVDGNLVIPKGTRAKGVVDFVRKAVPGKKDGRLSIKAIRVDPLDSAPIELREEDSEQDGLGDALAIVAPFCIIGELVTIPFHKGKQEAGKESVRDACSGSWGLYELKFSAGTVNIKPTPNARAEVGTDSACPNGFGILLLEQGPFKLP